MRRFSVPLAYVDGVKLATLALDPFGARDEASLLDCLVNREQVAACMAQPGQRFCHGAEDVREAAATEIQAGTRMALGRYRAARLRHMRWAALVLTRKGKVFALYQATKRRLQARAFASKRSTGTGLGNPGIGGWRLPKPDRSVADPHETTVSPQVRAEEQHLSWKKVTTDFYRDWPRIRQGEPHGENPQPAT